MEIELRHLKALVALAEHGSFTAAANALEVSQSTLSRTISQLERAAKRQMVERTTRSVQLTDEGAVALGSARAALAQVAQLLDVNELPEERELRLGWAWAGLGPHTATLLREWSERSSVPVVTEHLVDPITAVMTRAVDAAIVRRVKTELHAPDELVTSALFTETLVAAVPLDSALAAQSSVTVADLASWTIALCAVSPTVTQNLWLSRGASPHTVKVDTTEEWLERIADGRSVGVTSAATTAGHEHSGVTYRRLSDSPEVEVALLWPRSRPHEAAADFADHAREYFRSFIGKVAPPSILALEGAQV